METYTVLLKFRHIKRVGGCYVRCSGSKEARDIGISKFLKKAWEEDWQIVPGEHPIFCKVYEGRIEEVGKIIDSIPVRHEQIDWWTDEAAVHLENVERWSGETFFAGP